MHPEMIERLRQAMAEADLDVLVAISPENFAYTTGVSVPSHSLMRWRHNMAVVTRDGRTSLIVVDMEASTVRSRTSGTDVRVWGEFTDRPMVALAETLKEFGLSKGAIGIEMEYLPAADYLDLTKLLPGARLLPAGSQYDRLRQRKMPYEVELLRRLSRLADEAILGAFRMVRAGMTEMDIAAALTRGIYTRGAEHFKLMIVATGERSEYPNVGPSDRILCLGDLCRVEIFPVINGYHAGVCRTAVVERASSRASQIWQTLVECKYLILDMIRPGASTRAIYEAFVKRFSELGFPPIAFVGHGIGLHLHEEPYLGRYSDSRLEAGMVLGIEPLVYGTGLGFGLQNKDMVLVTENGAELLSDQTNTDELIVIA